jgi:hypothetical protein
MAMHNLPNSRRVYYPGLSGAQQSERPRIAGMMPNNGVAGDYGHEVRG